MDAFLKYLNENPAVADSLFWTFFILVLGGFVIAIMLAAFFPSKKNKPDRHYGGGFVE